MYNVIHGDCTEYLNSNPDITIDLTFFDPPFNQGKFYPEHDDLMDDKTYWSWMQNVLYDIRQHTAVGGAIYFMQRDKNVHHVMSVLENSGWFFKNLIIWKKKTSAVPMIYGFGKAYQVIVFAINGATPRVFNKLRINPPLLVTETYERPNGMFVTDVWDDIRELTSGYFAGNEPLRDDSGNRLHAQQSPLSLLTRIILSSSMPNDTIFDPFAGTGTSGVVAGQLSRNFLLVENSILYYNNICSRLRRLRETDKINLLYDEYRFTENLDIIWGELNAGR